MEWSRVEKAYPIADYARRSIARGRGADQTIGVYCRLDRGVCINPVWTRLLFSGLLIERLIDSLVDCCIVCFQVGLFKQAKQ
eukprot:5903916-Lingulodinium_polyedra.AAC.1